MAEPIRPAGSNPERVRRISEGLTSLYYDLHDELQDRVVARKDAPDMLAPEARLIRILLKVADLAHDFASVDVTDG